MTTSKAWTLCSLRFKTEPSYERNLDTFCTAIAETPVNTVIVAPEVCLTGFDYAHFDAAAAFGTAALQKLLPLSEQRILILTMIEKRGDAFYNTAKLLYRGRIVHQQAKSRLFELGDEQSHFNTGSEKEIVLIEVEGIRIGILICFELRFKTLWQRLEGADIIAVPAQWGRLRRNNYLTLTEALAIMNQCYVIASDADNEETTGESGIITPFGDAMRNGNALCLSTPYKRDEIKKMRRYLDVGINDR